MRILIGLFTTILSACLCMAEAQATIPYYSASISGTAVNQAATVSSISGLLTCLVDIEGAFSATVVFEGSTNNQTSWSPQTTGVVQPGLPVQTQTSIPGMFVVPCSSLTDFRTRISAYTSGTVNMYIQTLPGVFQGSQTVILNTQVLPATYTIFLANTVGTVVKSSPGIFYGAVNLSASNQGQTLSCFDNASAASGNPIFEAKIAAGVSVGIGEPGVQFTNGLTCSTSAALTSPGVAVYWR